MLGFHPGQTLHQYEIVQFLGEGGISDVYLANDTLRHQRVALKVIKPAVLNSKDFARRFIQEAQVMMNLNHPHILKVYDLVNEENLLYMVVQYADGGNLGEMIRAGYLTLPHISMILDQTASALDYAHAQNVIHRDVKPHNILLDSLGNCYLSDFGMVKRMHSQTQLTRTGIVLGTPAYMSPEQCRTKELVTYLSDVYSLGITLYEMLCGEVPFTGKVAAVILTKQLHDKPPPLSACNREVSPRVDAIVQKAMEKNPLERYKSAGELADAFRQEVYPGYSSGTAATPPPLPSVPAESIHMPAPTRVVADEGVPMFVLVLLVVGVLAIGIVFLLAVILLG